MQERSERLAQAIAQALQWLRIRDLSTQELARRLAGQRLHRHGDCGSYRVALRGGLPVRRAAAPAIDRTVHG
jgi:SOS response regulatory protein OraA/RecX